MTTAFRQPENALNRAEELCNVGRKQEALDTIHRVITLRRYRAAWNTTLERIMFKYIDLCVDMRKGVREGLNQYRNMCQQVNVSSLEEVIKHLMHLSSEKAGAVCIKADKRPEDLMLSYFSGLKEKDGSSDREPWLKYSWETYRTLLQVLQNNSKLEPLYAMTAHRAFQFCKQYKRSTEFRRLGELIRNHHPENLELYLDTRFEQLKVATELEIWQEAFRAVEDICGLMSVSMKVDHLRGAVVFGTDELSDQLVTFSESLNKSRAMIYPATEKASKLVPSLAETMEKEHRRLLARKLIIENSKEEQERLLLEREKEEESKRLELEKLAKEAENKRFASEIEKRKNERILREIQQRQLEDVTKQGLLKMKLNEQLREKQEMEKRVRKQGKMIDHLERAKREETSPLIESAYQLRLVEERILHEQEQLQEIELSRQRLAGDLQQKKRVARMLEQKAEFHDRLMTERREKINNMLKQKRQEIEVKRKMMFYLSTEMQRLEKLQKEDGARKLEEAERLKKEAAAPAKYVPRFKLRDSSAAAPDSSDSRRPGYGFGGRRW